LRIENAIPAGVMVACEVQDLNEMLGNLIDNACKHAKGRVALHIADNGPPGLVEIVVEDDGPGLPPEAWDVVFNVGEQWSEQATGSGLGLAIVRDLVELYGGKITLGQSELGGLKARLALPEFAEQAS
jgi:signal transduction histidine kinase